jgi:hypothetical protein
MCSTIKQHLRQRLSQITQAEATIAIRVWSVVWVLDLPITLASSTIADLSFSSPRCSIATVGSWAGAEQRWHAVRAKNGPAELRLEPKATFDHDRLCTSKIAGKVRTIIIDRVVKVKRYEAVADRMVLRMVKQRNIITAVAIKAINAVATADNFPTKLLFLA